MRLSVRLCLLLFAILSLTSFLGASSIVVSNDEWMFRNDVINTNDDIQFAKNVASFTTGGAPANILILSSNVALTGTIFKSTLQGQGYTLTYTSTQPASLSIYDAIFLAGPVTNGATLAANLTAYVNGGGNVFVEGGTGSFTNGATGEANFWNPFLNNFGLNFGTSYNGVCCNVNVSAYQTQGPYGPELFNNVDSLYMNNGNSVSVSGAGPGVQIFSNGNNGLFGVYRSPATTVPEPSSMMLLVGGIAAVATRLRRK